LPLRDACINLDDVEKRKYVWPRALAIISDDSRVVELEKMYVPFC
jgi:hypothetical protein